MIIVMDKVVASRFIYAPVIEDLVRRRRRSGRWNPL
jgi:hypothetical protein